jgi:class 3 adenylate cyclase
MTSPPTVPKMLSMFDHAAPADPRPRQVELTMVSVDIADSTRLAGIVGQREFWEITEELFTLCCVGVQRFAGRIERFTGDGVMAAFTGEQHAPRACRAALLLRDDIRGFSRELRYQCGVIVRTRIGINSGEAMVGLLGGTEAAMCGYPVALSKRIEELARPGTVCIGEATAALLGEEFELRDGRVVEPRGALGPLSVLELRAVEYAELAA